MSASVCANGHSKGPSLWVCGMNGDHPPELLGAAWARAPLTAPLTGQVSPALSLFCTAPPISHGQCETHSRKCLSQSPVLGCCTQRRRHTGQGPMTDEIAGSPVKEQGNACNALRHAASSSLRFLSTRHGGYKVINYRRQHAEGKDRPSSGRFRLLGHRDTEELARASRPAAPVPTLPLWVLRGTLSERTRGNRWGMGPGPGGRRAGHQATRVHPRLREVEGQWASWVV